MMLFPKALFLVTNFRKNKKIIQFFYRIFIQKFQYFLKISQQFVFFVQTRKKWTHSLLNVFEKYAKIMHFRNFLKKNFQDFRKFSQKLE